MKNFFILIWWIVVTIDWSSTIAAHDYRVEENPLMRGVWQSYGDLGFTLASLAFGVVISLVIHYGYKYAFKWPVIIAFVPMVTFKALIALTNLVLIPLWVTSWFNF